jgi:predicted ATPase
MRLTGFSVQNYRGFAELTAVELRPLTLLFGYNSAGKSALLRWLPIVAASSGPDSSPGLALDVDAARGASFDDMLSRYSGSNMLGLGFRWRDTASEDELRVDMRLLWEARRRQQIVEQLRAVRSSQSGTHEVLVTWSLDDEGRRYTIASEGEALERELAFEGLALVPPPEPAAAGAVLSAAHAAMTALRSSVHWLTAVRAVPERSKELAARPRRLGPDGASAGDLLAHDRLTDGRILATVATWFRGATGHDLDVQIESVAGKDRFSLVLSPTGGQRPVRVPLPDTGEGMAQVLPVIVLGALARHGHAGSQPLLLIEHPELHLHPMTHAHLAGYFCALAKDCGAPRRDAGEHAEGPGALSRGVTTVVETHSENVLLRVQLAILRGELDPAHVIVHWVRSLPEGPAVVESITFDALARPQGDWPPRVFSSDVLQAREIVELRRKRSAP